METGIFLHSELAGFGLEETIDIARRADRNRFHSVWKGETAGRNNFMTLGLVAEHTDSVRLGSGIANVYSRSPALLAMSAMTLDEMSDGRACLGLGVSSPPIVEDWHGFEFERPLRRTREVIEIARQCFDNGTVEYEGDLFDIGPYATRFDRARTIPIWNAATGEVNRRLTGEFADGWMPIFVPKDRLEAFTADVYDGATDAGRTPEDITVAPWLPTAVHDDPDLAAQRVRELIAQEMAMGYNEVVRSHGFGDTADEAHDLWREGDRDAAAAAVTDEMLSAYAVWGTPQDCREELAAFEDIVDVTILMPSFTATPIEIHTLIETLGPT